MADVWRGSIQFPRTSPSATGRSGCRVAVLAGGDLVQAVVTGAGELVGLTIEPGAVDLDDLESLSDLIIAAVRDAGTQAANQAQALMPDLGGLGF